MTKISTSKLDLKAGRPSLSRAYTPKAVKTSALEYQVDQSQESSSALPRLIKQINCNDGNSILTQDHSRMLDGVHDITHQHENLDDLAGFPKYNNKRDEKVTRQDLKDSLQKKYSFFNKSIDARPKKSFVTGPNDSPVAKQYNRRSKLSILTSMKSAKNSPSPKESPSPSHPNTNSSQIQKFHVEGLNKLQLKKVIQPFRNPTPNSESHSPQKLKKILKGKTVDYTNNPHPEESSIRDMSPSRDLANEVDDINILGEFQTPHSNASSPKKRDSLPQMHERKISTNSQDDELVYRPTNAHKKKLSLDPFDQIVKYQNNKMPFYLALNAETRQKMFQEVKKKSYDHTAMDTIIELRNKRIPEARAKYIDEVSSVESKKKGEELRSRSPDKNVLYQLYALDKSTKKKVKTKLEQHVSEASRFLNF